MAIGLAAAILAAAVKPLARQGIDLLGGVFNGATQAGAERIAAEIEKRTGIRVEDIADDRLTAEDWAQLKEFELQNQEALLAELQAAQGHDIDRTRLMNEDRADARALQRVAMADEDWLTRNFIHLYAILLTGFTFAFIAWAAFGARFDTGADGAPSAAGQAQIRTVDTVLGFLLGVSLSAIIQFFFGSSKGSNDKSRMLEDLLRGTAQPKGR